MHYANGRKSKLGDFVVGKDCCGNPQVGFVVEQHAGADSCNLQVAVIKATDVICVTAKECLHIDDAIAPKKA